MQFTKAEGNGLFGVMHLAKQDNGPVVSLSEIAERQDIPEKFLAKSFQGLTKAGLLRSHRGVHGGFAMMKPPSEMMVGEVLDAIQGDEDPIKCAIYGEECPKIESCAVRDLIIKGREHMFSYYNNRTIKDLADQD